MKNLDRIDTIQPHYLINYQNGYVQPATSDTLEGAIKEAIENIAYTQCDVIITDLYLNPIAIARWHSTPPDETIGDETLEIIGFGWYEPFTDYETGEYI